MTFGHSTAHFPLSKLIFFLRVAIHARTHKDVNYFSKISQKVVSEK